MSNAFIAVEGHHDVEFVSGILEAQGFHKEVMVERLDSEFCTRLINTKFPHQGDLHKRVPNPMFLTNGQTWVAVQPAGGREVELARVVEEALYNLQDTPESLAALAVVRDADQQDPADQLATAVSHMQSLSSISGFSIELPTKPGTIAGQSPRFGFYVLPDNLSHGTLDNVILECGETVYSELLSGAREYVDGVDVDKLEPRDARLIRRPSGRTKAVVACAANILKPGMSIATSIDQNRWLNEESLKLPRVAALASFLKDLCGLN